MKLNTDCPVCHDDNAFHNGVNYECPDCGSAWDEDMILENGLDDQDEDENIDIEFKSVANLEKPFFKLKQGKIYECTIGYIREDKFEEEQFKIIPLAFQENSNTFFIIKYDPKHLKIEPKEIEDLAQMDFTTIWNDGIENYFNYSEIPFSSIAATTENNSIVDTSGNFYYDLDEVES